VHNEHSLIAEFVKRSKRDRYKEILSNSHLRHNTLLASVGFQSPIFRCWTLGTVALHTATRSC
jgi:hypothetical protein